MSAAYYLSLAFACAAWCGVGAVGVLAVREWRGGRA